MRVLIFTSTPFPIGHAATNRILSYCYGLLKNDVSIRVISTSLKSTSLKKVRHIIGDTKRLRFIGVPFFQTKVTRLIHRWFLYAVYPNLLTVLVKRERYNAIILYGPDKYFDNCILRLSKRYSLPALRELNEHPSIALSNVEAEVGSAFFQESVMQFYRRYDGLLIMTDTILDYMGEIGLSKDALIKIPQTTILKKNVRISPCLKLRFKDYLLFTGSLSNKKDGVLNLIKAYDLVRERHLGLGLVITGFGSKEQIRELHQTIEELNLGDLVQVFLNLSSNDIPSLMKDAKILVSPRPYSLQALYGFPTKVAEYLMAGRPVVTSAFGDLSQHLIDGVNAFVLPSGDIPIIAEAILRVLDNYKDAIRVGIRGKELALEMFDPQKNTRPLVDWLVKMESSRRNAK